MPREVIIEKLDFDAAQIQDYDVTIKRHQNAIRQLDAAIKTEKKNLYSKLKTHSNKITTAEASIQKIGRLQQEIEVVHYQHFLEIKAICKTEQKTAFDALLLELSHLFSPGKRPRHER